MKIKAMIKTENRTYVGDCELDDIEFETILTLTNVNSIALHEKNVNGNLYLMTRKIESYEILGYYIKCMECEKEILSKHEEDLCSDCQKNLIKEKIVYETREEREMEDN
jgi:RecJ-like exonuclease